MRRFDTGNLVLREVSQATKDSSQGKLRPTWEGTQKNSSLQRRIIPPEDLGWPKTTSSMEHRTPKEILSIRIPKYSKMLTFI